MEHIKLQLGCMVILLYIGFVYLQERRRNKINRRKDIFDVLLIMGIIEIFFDGATAYTVNRLDTVPPLLNRFLHLCFLISIDVIIFVWYMYIISISNCTTKRRRDKILRFIPLALNLIVVFGNISSLEYLEGNYSNYSMGVSAITCFVMAGVYMIASLTVYIRQWRYIESRKRISTITCCAAIIAVVVIQALIPDILLTSLATTFIAISVYINQEDPVFTKLENYHREMIMGFAALVDSRDNSTGGHIRRTTAYAELLAKKLQEQGLYRETLTKDYVTNLIKAAPMHDVGKIAIPDAILQKTAKLTVEEFDIMKTHAEKGGEIIKATFSNIGEEQYVEIAYQVARYHHEKWNGKGYPEGLKNKDIPLCARIVAVADVFDAVSSKRCYRDAMSLEECYQIIQRESGMGLDPVIVDVFLDMKEQVEEVYRNIVDKPALTPANTKTGTG